MYNPDKRFAQKRVTLCPVDNAIKKLLFIGFPNTYWLDSDLSNEQLYPMFEQPGPGYRCLRQLFYFLLVSFNMKSIGCFSKRTGMPVDNGEAHGKD